jgi:hypothetical protein
VTGKAELLGLPQSQGELTIREVMELKDKMSLKKKESL